jgi:hypothetical protein
MAVSPDSDSFDLLTAIRYDSSLLNCPGIRLANQGQSSPFLLLPYHFSRLIAAATLHGWRHPFTPPSWSSFQHACQRAVETYNGPNKGGPLKVSVRFAFLFFDPFDKILVLSFDLCLTVPVPFPSPHRPPISSLPTPCSPLISHPHRSPLPFPRRPDQSISRCWPYHTISVHLYQDHPP